LSKERDGDQDVVQLNIKLASLEYQSQFYGDILAAAIEGLVTRAERVSMTLDAVQSLRNFGDRVQGYFHVKLGAEPLANVKPLVIKLRDGAEHVRMSARKYVAPQLMVLRDK
jgi:hypothetical protein